MYRQPTTQLILVYFDNDGDIFSIKSCGKISLIFYGIISHIIFIYKKTLYFIQFLKKLSASDKTQIYKQNNDRQSIKVRLIVKNVLNSIKRLFKKLQIN